MLGRSTGAVLLGIDARLVDVEVDLGRGLPRIAAVGLPDPAVREGIDRIRAALRHAGYELPQRRVIVNLAPADLRKHGAALDLPIAGALLLASGQIGPLDSRAVAMAGELALDGSLRPVRGALAMAEAARAAGRRTFLVPADNADEAALVEGIEVVPISTLSDVDAVGRGHRPARRALPAWRQLAVAREREDSPDLSEVRGQASARRALEVSAAGGHHLLLSGPPGAGKSMLAQRLPGILPGPSVAEALVITRIHSAAGLVRGLVAHRPFRAPHHGVSPVGMTGGGPALRPGEISLATHGVLFLDELTEYRRDVLESLRQPLEEGRITVVRIRGSATFPAAFTLVASMNPCPCGYLGSPDGSCSCTPAAVRRYRARLSGPLLDRFDLVVDVPPVDLAALAGAREGESSAAVQRRVVAARDRQQRRFGPEGPTCNARMRPTHLDRVARPGPAGRRLLLDACHRLGLSARGFDRVRRVARTLADLDGRETIATRHLAEALQYRHPRRSELD